MDRVRAASAELSSSGPAATAPVSKVDRTPLAVVPEGTQVLSRRGRLARVGTDSELAFLADNDPNSPSPGPMVLLPCRALEQLEAAAGAYGDNITLSVSGRVTVYQSRNYLLPAMYQVVRTGDVQPHQ